MQSDVIAELCGLSTTYCYQAPIKSLLEARIKKNFSSEVILCCAFGIPGLFHFLNTQAVRTYEKAAQDTAVILAELTVEVRGKR